jgi:hypothetical protein
MRVGSSRRTEYESAGEGGRVGMRESLP